MIPFENDPTVVGGQRPERYVSFLSDVADETRRRERVHVRLLRSQIARVRPKDEPIADPSLPLTHVISDIRTATMGKNNKRTHRVRKTPPSTTPPPCTPWSYVRQILSTEMLRGCAAGDEAVVARALAMGADVSATCAMGNNVFHVATICQNLPLLDALLQHVADSWPADVMRSMLDTRNLRFGCTPLHCALAADDLTLVALLLDHGARVDVHPDLFHRTPFFAAVFDCKVDAMRLFLAGAGDDRADLLATHIPVDGRTPLHVACDVGDVDMTCLLLEQGADAGAIDARGRTPVGIAASSAVDGMTRSMFGHVHRMPDDRRKALVSRLRFDSHTPEGVAASRAYDDFLNFPVPPWATTSSDDVGWQNATPQE